MMTSMHAMLRSARQVGPRARGPSQGAPSDLRLPFGQSEKIRHPGLPSSICCQGSMRFGFSLLISASHGLRLSCSGFQVAALHHAFAPRFKVEARIQVVLHRATTTAARATTFQSRTAECAGLHSLQDQNQKRSQPPGTTCQVPVMLIHSGQTVALDGMPRTTCNSELNQNMPPSISFLTP